MIYYQTFVSPGIGAALHTLFYLRALITEDFPTFGYPTNPTLIFYLFLWKLSNYLNKLTKDPLPKLLFIEAWKAIVGYSLPKVFTHLEVTQVGTKSHLFKTNIKCLWGQFFLICSSTCLDLVP